MKTKELDAYDWWKAVGTARAKFAVARAGIKWGYFVHIYRCRKSPSMDVATALAHASMQESLADRKSDRVVMTVSKLMRTTKQREARKSELEKLKQRRVPCESLMHV